MNPKLRRGAPEPGGAVAEQPRLQDRGGELPRGARAAAEELRGGDRPRRRAARQQEDRRGRGAVQRGPEARSVEPLQLLQPRPALPGLQGRPEAVAAEGAGLLPAVPGARPTATTPDNLQREAEKRIKDIDEIYVALDEAAKMQAEAEEMQKKAEEQQKQMEEQMKKQEADEAAARQGQGSAPSRPARRRPAPRLRRRRRRQGRRQGAPADGGCRCRGRRQEARRRRSSFRDRSDKTKECVVGAQGSVAPAVGTAAGGNARQSYRSDRLLGTADAPGCLIASDRAPERLEGDRIMKKLIIGIAVISSLGRGAACRRRWPRQRRRPQRQGGAPAAVAATTPTPRTRPRPSTTSKTTRSKATCSVPTASSSTR